MLPVSPYPLIEDEAAEITSKTYKLDFAMKRIYGRVDGQEAFIQAMEKLFQTERFAWTCYSQTYGIELTNLVGANMDFVIAVLESRIKDAVMVDDRALSCVISNLTLLSKDTLSVEVEIRSIFGTVTIRREMTFSGA